MVTIKDIAKKANVGKSTVSRYLNNTGYVRAETGKKIQSAIEELNYKPNKIARAMVKNKTNIIGLLLPNILNRFFIEIAREIELRLNKIGYTVLLCNTENDAEKEMRYLNILLGYRVDGIISLRPLLTKEYIELKCPLVIIDRNISEQINTIQSDNYDGGRQVAELFCNTHGKKVLFISSDINIESTIKRRKGFVEHLHSNIQFNELVYRKDEDFICELKSHITNGVDSIFVWNDDVASRILLILDNLGYKVPDDVQVVGYDNIYYSEYTKPPLTTIKQNTCEIGNKAVNILQDIIEGNNTSPKEYIYSVELVTRKSSKEL